MSDIKFELTFDEACSFIYDEMGNMINSISQRYALSPQETLYIMEKCLLEMKYDGLMNYIKTVYATQQDKSDSSMDKMPESIDDFDNVESE